MNTENVIFDPVAAARHVSCIRVVGNQGQMLNLEAFRELCRKASIERDPAELQKIKDALRFMLQTEGIEMYGVEKKPGLKPN